MAAVVLAVLLCLGSGVTKGRTQEVEETDVVEETAREFSPWNKCALQLSPSCLKLTLARLVDRLENSRFQPLPGVELISNGSRALQDSSAGADGKEGQLMDKVAGFLSLLTLRVKLLELPVFNTTRLVDNLVTNVTGRKNKGNTGLLAVALMMGGSMMAMMMAALAAMSGKALMTGMAALMLAALGALKGHGGGGKSTTYEVIAQPEVHHGHGWKRSVDAQDLVYLYEQMKHTTT